MRPKRAPPMRPALAAMSNWSCGSAWLMAPDNCLTAAQMSSIDISGRCSMRASASAIRSLLSIARPHLVCARPSLSARTPSGDSSAGNRGALTQPHLVATLVLAAVHAQRRSTMSNNCRTTSWCRHDRCRRFGRQRPVHHSAPVSVAWPRELAAAARPARLRGSTVGWMRRHAKAAKAPQPKPFALRDDRMAPQTLRAQLRKIRQKPGPPYRQ